MSFNLNVEFQCIECAKCAIPFAITIKFMQLRKRDHKPFACPSGHKNFFNSKTEAEINKELADKLQEQLDFIRRLEQIRCGVEVDSVGDDTAVLQ